MFATCLTMIGIGLSMTFEAELTKNQNSDIGPTGNLNKTNKTGVDPSTAKCLSICLRNQYCFFYGIDENGLCKTFKIFNSDVKYRLYARKPAAAIDFLSSPLEKEIPAAISIKGKAKHEGLARGVHLVEVTPELNGLVQPAYFDENSLGSMFTKYIKGLRKGTIIAAATKEDATKTLEMDYLKSQGLDFSTIRINDPYIFLVQKGYPNKSILIRKSSNTGNLKTSIRIYHQSTTPDLHRDQKVKVAVKSEKNLNYAALRTERVNSVLMHLSGHCMWPSKDRINYRPYLDVMKLSNYRNYSYMNRLNNIVK